MIDWGDTLRESEGRAVAQAHNSFEREMGLREAIGRVGNPQNPTGDNFIEATFNTNGKEFLRCDQTLISDGWLLD